MLGFVFASISSIFFSLYVVPRKVSRLSSVAFCFFMALGFSVSAIILYLFQPLLQFHETVSQALWWAVVAGVIWAAGFVCFVKAIDLLGLSRSTQWKNLQGPVAVLLSLLILSEFTTTNPFFAILAALAIFFSAICFTIPSGQGKRFIYKGIYLACIAAVAFGSVAVMQKHVTSEVGVYTQQVVWSLSIFVSLACYIVGSKKTKELRTVSKKEIGIGLMAGILYLGANLFQLLSYNYLNASIAFTVVQLNALWTVLIGIFLFKEINFGKYYKRVSLGFLFTIVGILLLVFARR